MDINKNYFEFIGLPISFHIDQAELSDRSRELQKTLHPDRYAHQSEREQRIAVQYMAHLNEGVATLKSPLLRAQYLLQLQGIDTTVESSTPIDPMFLMQQMELREELEEIPESDDPYAALETLLEEVNGLLRQLREQFAQTFEAADLDAATAAVRKMQFLEKLVLEIERLEDKLDG
ncbi:Fe-S protein assembly co-chaperone HscB [Neptuniibacter halophilus]|uniref:Fe-S protein assembly co-chaperone HscB n=1 Tax=Neptuniibacter halophilus TaxID=651666 RepID=UPI0025735DEF|nr:Fe-S protein assembly co-chaperone HscB [Neptuniibacter halophilus]